MATVATAEGLRLHLSTWHGLRSYKCVSKQGRVWRAQYWSNGKTVTIGRNYATAVEAAVAYARTVGEYEPPTVVTEAEGLRLHLSSRCRTGYKGVCEFSGRFRVDLPEAHSGLHLGHFGTAVEAAVAYARAVAAADAAQAAQPVEAPSKRMRVASGRAAASAAQAKAEAAAAQERAADRTLRQQARAIPASTAGTRVKLEAPHPTRSAARSQGGASGGAATSVRGTPASASASASVKWEAPEDQPSGKWQRGAPLVAPPPAPVTAPTGPPLKWERPDDQPSGKWQRGAPPAATATNLEVSSGGEGEDDEVEITGGCSRSEKDAAGWANAIELDGD